MSSAGQQLVAGRIPGERIATTKLTADSALFTTTEIIVVSVIAPVIIGRTYRVTFEGKWRSTVAGDEVLARIREDTVSGGQLFHALFGTSTSAFGCGPQIMEAEYVADASQDKTFVVTGDRNSGTGDLNLVAGSLGAAYLYVDYISG